ncbi:MAG TPA: hypothetical protein VGA56_26230 [Opitutaceae bacterium]
MTTQTKEAPAASDLFEEAFKTYEQSLKTSINIQEDTVKLWKDLLTSAKTPTDFKKRIGEMADEIFPAAKKRMEQALQSMEENSKAGTDLLQKAFQVWQPGTVAEAQNRVRELWESSLSAVRMNAQTIVKTNQQVLDYWTSMMGSDSRREKTAK